jgi:hypothetical protein
MKIFLIIAAFFAATLMSFSQSLGYQDLGILFSQNDHIGSARFKAMSGAFGALGGDISSINVNPAGISVFKNSIFSGTFNSKNSEINASFGDANFNDRRTLTTNNEYMNLSHAGAVLVFDSAYSSEWSKFAIGFNYRITRGFSDNFSAEGNEAITTFDTNPRDTNTPKTRYNFTDGQLFNTSYGGEITELNIAFSAVHQKKLHIGMSLNFYDLNFSQQSVLTELNSDVDGTILDVELYQENFTTGTGFSANAGFIYKAHQSVRFGLAYQTPTWYNELLQDTNYNQDSNIDIGETTFFPENEETFSEFNDRQLISYRLQTPSKLTASAAIIFGKNGLLSLDYINKNYRKIKLSNGVFTNENQHFQNDLKNTHNYNIGTEWRFDNFSIRGGYNFEQTPNTSNFINDNSVMSYSDIKGYSLGGGYNFGNFKLDFAYTNNNSTSSYNFYNGFNAEPANLTLDNRIFTTTFTLSL